MFSLSRTDGRIRRRQHHRAISDPSVPRDWRCFPSPQPAPEPGITARRKPALHHYCSFTFTSTFFPKPLRVVSGILALLSLQQKSPLPHTISRHELRRLPQLCQGNNSQPHRQSQPQSSTLQLQISPTPSQIKHFPPLTDTTTHLCSLLLHHQTRHGTSRERRRLCGACSRRRV